MNTPTPETETCPRCGSDPLAWQAAKFAAEGLQAELRQARAERDAALELLAKTKRQLTLALDGFVKLQNERNAI